MAKRSTPVEKRFRINHQIRVPQVRLIDSDGTAVGIKTIQEALQLAQERGHDLVEIAPTAVPPVCKIISYSKLRYEQEKKERDARKKQKGGHLKEIRIRPTIGDHDLAIKLRHASDFLEDNDKVRVVVMFKGRENAHKDIGRALMKRIEQALLSVGEREQSAAEMGNRIFMSFIPVHKKIKKASSAVQKKTTVVPAPPAPSDTSTPPPTVP